VTKLKIVVRTRLQQSLEFPIAIEKTAFVFHQYDFSEIADEIDGDQEKDDDEWIDEVFHISDPCGNENGFWLKGPQSFHGGFIS